MVVFHCYVSSPEGIYSVLSFSDDHKMERILAIFCNTIELLSLGPSRHKEIRVCLKIGYTPNYSHLVGIMIINHWVIGYTIFRQTHYVTCEKRICKEKWQQQMPIGNRWFVQVHVCGHVSALNVVSVSVCVGIGTQSVNRIPLCT